ncbi:outer membrane protein assembly factor BamB family protein [Actinoplanes subglobosus]|uniref:PQQ-binding-like beta-propeller repeat protein n=1 Tax=Actinoplanes subglobosus TaxID=1547892 RepID=A0ABV8IXY1_9ACTN
MTVSVIDLGDVSYSPDDPEDYRDGRRAIDRIRVSRAARVALVLLVALFLGGSGLPGPPVLREMWSVPFSEADSMVIGGDALYVRRSLLGVSELTAYDLATGTIRWTRGTGPGPAWMGIEPRPQVLLLPGEEQVSEVRAEDGSSISFSYGGTLTALDPATGEALWERPGLQYWDSPGDTMLMFERVRDGSISWIRLVRTRDGSTVWERRAAAGTDNVVVQFDGDVPTRVVTADPEGELTVLRYTDGTVVTSGIVPWTPMSYSTGAGTSLNAVAGRIIVADTGLGPQLDESRVTAYRTDDLVKLWSRDTSGWPNVQDCGPVICLGTAQDQIEGVEPETGAKRWGMPGGQFVGTLPGTGNVLVAGTDDKPLQTLVDAATGRVIGTGGSGGLLHHDPVDGSVTLLRGRELTSSAVSRLDTATGRSTTLGVVSGGNQRYCIGEGRRIACTTGDRLVVTAVG